MSAVLVALMVVLFLLVSLGAVLAISRVMKAEVERVRAAGATRD